MKILIGMPVYLGIDHTKLSLESIIKGFDVLLIDNGSEPVIKNWINQNADLISHVIVNQTNILVNPGWQQILDYFLDHKEYTHLIITSSDLILQHQWDKIVLNFLEKNPDDIIIPNIVESVDFDVNADLLGYERVSGGTPGVFITMNRKQAQIINPFPKECKLWFGDEYFYTVIRRLGYRTIIPCNLFAQHYFNGSQNVLRTVNGAQIIENDKIMWKTVEKPLMLKKINEYSNTD